MGKKKMAKKKFNAKAYNAARTKAFGLNNPAAFGTKSMSQRDTVNRSMNSAYKATKTFK